MDAQIPKRLKLKSGYEMPVLGLGTWELTGEECVEIVRRAVDAGYEHIDTAEAYGNESEIGGALEGADREKLFITSKVASENLDKAGVLEACKGSLGRLRTDYLDLYLAHWPNDEISLAETVEGMRQLVEEGMVRSVGLSNFDVERIKKVLSIGGVQISNLQIEYHPFTRRTVLPEFCAREGITVTAYSPLARGRVFENATLMGIAEKHDKSAAQVSLRWLVQKGNIVIPKASSEEHLLGNMDIFDWELDEEDMESIDKIESQQRLVDTRYT